MQDEQSVSHAALNGIPTDPFTGVREVSHMVVATLAILLQDGTVDPPELKTWNEWQAWRSEEGPHRRPRSRRDGFSVSQNHEKQLWQTIMGAYYGPDWMRLLTSS